MSAQSATFKMKAVVSGDEQDIELGTHSFHIDSVTLEGEGDR